MIRIAPIDQIHGDTLLLPRTIIWRLVKRLGDFKPIDGAEYLVKKTRNAAPLIYRAVNGRLKSTGDTFVRWGIFGDSSEDLIRIPR